MSSPTPGFPWRDALPFLEAAGVSVLTWFVAQFTAVARLQKSLLDASRSFVERAQALHVQDGARTSELEKELVEHKDARFKAEAEVLRLRGEVRQFEQKVASQRRLIERFGLDDGHGASRTSEGG